jgi:NADH:ubiquinone oxidoreductase subunit 2 (subunit N)
MKFSLFVFLKLIFFDIFSLTSVVLYVSICSYLVGAILTILQKKIIRFLAFGSISHISLVLAVFILGDLGMFSIVYLVIYFISLCKFIYLLNFTILNLENIVYLTDLNYLLDLPIKSAFLFSIMELGGLPPYNIFVIKLIFFFFLLKNNFFGLTLYFLIMSLFSTYYYVRLIKNIFFDLNTPFVIMKYPLDFFMFYVIELTIILAIYEFPFYSSYFPI